MTDRLSSATLSMASITVRKPRYDRSSADQGVLHFGPGAFHRAHQASYFDDLASQERGWGVTGVSLNGTAVREALTPQDGLFTLIVRGKADETRIVGALREILVAPQHRQQVRDRFLAPALRLVTATVTEKGYPIDADGVFDPRHPAAAADLADPMRPVGLTGWLVEGLRLRRAVGLAPPVIVSCDNIDANGAKLRRAVIAHARRLDTDLADWIDGEVRFPDTMVDSITPATTDALRAEALDRTGLTDAWPIEREAYRRWVIEDVPAPALRRLGDVGVVLTGDVTGHAEAKLRLLNATHSALAYFGLLRGYETVAQAMADVALSGFCRRMMHEDVAPRLAVPSLNLQSYANEISTRLAEPAIAHRLAQIAADGSRKLPVRVVPTIAAALAAGRPIDRPAAVIAAWMRFVVRQARTGESIADPEAAKLVDIAGACHGEPDRDVALFRAGLPELMGPLWGERKVIEALGRGYRDEL